MKCLIFNSSSLVNLIRKRVLKTELIKQKKERVQHQGSHPWYQFWVIIYISNKEYKQIITSTQHNIKRESLLSQESGKYVLTACTCSCLTRKIHKYTPKNTLDICSYIQIHIHAPTCVPTYTYIIIHLIYRALFKILKDTLHNNLKRS